MPSDSSIARAQVGGAKPDDDGSGSGTAAVDFVAGGTYAMDVTKSGR